MERKYNLLTQKLLAEGYTLENHPDYVRIAGSAWGKELHQNLKGGFEYTPEYLNNMVFKTGCGLLTKGRKWIIGSMSFMGIEWMPENDNSTLTCPYRKNSCNLRNPILGGPNGSGLSKLLFCDCHQTDELFVYEKSVDKVISDRERERKKKYDAYAEKVGGHVCYWHMFYDEWADKWIQKYDPMKCAKYCQRIGGICDLTHRPVSKKKGNVFYDVMTSYIRNDGTIFDGEEVITIKKGIRLFKTGKSMTICEAAVKAKSSIIDKVMTYQRNEISHGMKVKVLNIRAEQRESRDLMQDLQDIRDGIKIIHASDLEKQEKEQKKRKIEELKKKKIEKLEKKILEVGYFNLDPYSLDRVHADKWLGTERINELEEIREQKLKEKREEPVQLSIFDMMW